ncbi:AraC family transcriptional regulator N-terminal domain-containing protein [Bordetella hinzii]|uniref:AraC family transcriptional regulator n=1 Tax=Bordetella hinzii TaxID=103855 RepID=UPI0039FBDC34
MNDPLLDAARRYAQAHAAPNGVARTPIAGLTVIRATRPSGIDYAISRPLACLVLQGRKSVAMGAQSVEFGAGDSLLITSDVPTVSQVTRASAAEPYLSLVLDLDRGTIAELAAEMKLGPPAPGAHLRAEPSDAEVADAALRLLHLLERPAALPVLQAQRLREMHYWLLVGRHGPVIRRLGWPGSQAQRVARAIALLRAEFAQPLPMRRLAEAAGMSASSFYQHFREATSLSPLQFQKQLRLIEARRLMTADGLAASAAAFAVGYESVQQFTREYRRMFGLPPAKDTEAGRAALAAA